MEGRIRLKRNPYIKWLDFIKAMVVNMALRGNAFAIIQRDDDGQWIGLIPVAVDNVRIDTDEGLIYWVTINGSETPVSPENMLHFKLFSPDGVIGMSPVECQAETIGLARAAQDWSARFMRKGGFTGGYIIYQGFLTKEQQAQIKAKLPDIRQGDVDDLGKMAILQGGPTITPAGLTQKDSQFIESQQFQEEALAGIWGVPLYLTNRARSTSVLGSNLEQQTSGFVTFGLKPYLDALESEINDKLFSETRDGRRVRVIKKAELWEASVVPFGMNPEAQVMSVKSDVRTFESALRERMGLSQKEAAAVASLGFPAIHRDGGIGDTETVQQLKQLGTTIESIFKGTTQ